MGMDVLTAISPGQLLTKITNDELTLLMGGHGEDIKIEGNPAVVLIASFPEKVVLPDPCKPAISTTAGLPSLKLKATRPSFLSQACKDRVRRPSRESSLII